MSHGLCDGCQADRLPELTEALPQHTVDNVELNSNGARCQAIRDAACVGLQTGASHGLGDRSEADRAAS